MKINLIKRTILLFIVFMLLWICKVNAAGSFSVSASKTSIEPGEEVTLTITGNNAMGVVDLSATNATLDSSKVFLQTANDSKTVVVTSTSSEDIKISAKPGSEGLGDSDENPITTTRSLTISVNNNNVNNNNNSNSNNNNNSNNESGSSSGNTSGNSTKSKKSSNANLSNLGITPNDFSGFTPSKTSYSVSVPNDVTTVSIYANKGQSDQTISGTGSKTLQEGTNTFEVVVTAEDGTKKTYTLNITRETATENETENETANETANETTGEITQTGYTIGLKSLTISGVELSPSFSTGVYQYTAKLIGDRTTLDINAIALDENQKIEITGNEDLKEGENVITIIVTNAENTGSSENTTNTLNETTEETVNNTVTYQIIVNKSLVDEEAIARENAQKEQQKRTIIITILGVAIAIVVIILIVRYVRHRGEAEDFDGLYLPEEDNNYDDNFSNNNFSDNLGNEQQYDEDANKDFDLDQDNDGYEEHKSKRKGKRFK